MSERSLSARVAGMSTRAPAMPPPQRRAQLEESAVRVLLRRGLAATTREIATEAGVAEGTIFRVFDSKDELVHAALCRACDPEPLYARLEAVDLDQPLRERLVEAVTVIQERRSTVFDLLAAVGMLAPPGDRPEGHHGRHGRGQLGHGGHGDQHDARRSWQGCVQDRLVAIIQPDVDDLRVPVHELALLVRLLTFAGSHRHITGGDLVEPEVIVDALLDGARTGPTC